MSAPANSSSSRPMTIVFVAGVDARDVARAVVARREAGALTDRVARRRRACAPTRSPVRRDDRACAMDAGTDPLEHVAVVAALHEADVLRFGLVVHRQSQAARVLARRRLVELAERQQQTLRAAPARAARARRLDPWRARCGRDAGRRRDARCARSGRSRRSARPCGRRSRASVPSFTKLLHATHGLGVRPAA